MKLLHGERLDQGKTEITPDAIREAVARALTIADSDDPDRETGIEARPVLWMVNLEAADAAIAAYEAARAKAIVIRHEVDGRWIGEVPDLPGVMAYGATESEARRLTEALALRVVADRIEHGEASPAYYGTTYIKAEPQPMPTHLERARKLLKNDYQPNTCNFCGGIYPNPECDYIRKTQDAGKAAPCEAVGDTDLCVAVAAEFAAIERETLERTIRSEADAVVEAERLAIEALARHV